VAAIGLAFAALGTETRGSILEPASKGNVVGIKPSMGLASRSLVIPLTSYQDTVGPLARIFYDAAVVLPIIVGVDQYANYTSAIPDGGKIPDYVATTTEFTNLTCVRIGVPRNSFGDDLLYEDVKEYCHSCSIRIGNQYPSRPRSRNCRTCQFYTSGFHPI
jgi:amidase